MKKLCFVLIIAIIAFFVFRPVYEDQSSNILPDGENLPALPKTIKGDLPVKVHSVRLTRSSKSLTYPFSGSFRIWDLRLVLENIGKNTLVFGNECVLFESNGDETNFDGMSQKRLEVKNSLSRYFGVSNSQTNNEENSYIRRYAGNLIQWNGSQESIKPINQSFGKLLSGSRFVLQLRFKLGTKIKDKILEKVTFTSPVLYQPNVNTGPAALLVFSFSRPTSNEDSNKVDWVFENHYQTSLDFNTTSELVENNHTPTPIRIMAVNWLAEIYRGKSLPILRNRLLSINKSHVDTRAAVINALEELKDKESVPLLTDILKDDDQATGLWRRTAHAIGNMGDSRSVDVLSKYVRNENQYISKEAIHALGKIGGPKAFAILCELLKDRQFSQSDEAAAALLSYNSEAIQVLSDAIADERVDVAKTSIETMGKMLLTNDMKTDNDTLDKKESAKKLREAKPALSPDSARLILSAFEHAFKNKQEEVAQTAVKTVAKIPGIEASKLIIRSLQTKTGPVEELIEAVADRQEPEGVAIILGFLNNSILEKICETAIHAAVQMNMNEASTSLIELANNAKNDARSAAIRALGDLKIEHARKSLETIVIDTSQKQNHREYALSAINKLDGNKSEDILLKVAVNKKDKLRWKCLEYLSGSKLPEANKAIQSALADTDESGDWQRNNLREKFSFAREKAKSPALANQILSSHAEIRRDAAYQIYEKKDLSILSKLKGAFITEQDEDVFWSMVKALRALRCRDHDLIPALMEKLEAKEKNIVFASASMLRYITGIHNGPFRNGTDAEFAEDVKYWQSIKKRL